MVTQPRRASSRYDNNVFVNCPFDPDYTPLFRALIFAVEYCGFAARCALEIDDSGQTRAAKLLDLIARSRCGIHDISRVEVPPGGLPRFNMPYEFGLFAGFKAAGDARQKRKAILVLDSEPHRYQRVLSDIAGQDIKAHGGRPDRLIRSVRHWLQGQTRRQLVGGGQVVEKFELFRQNTPRYLAELKKTEDDLDNYPDFAALVHLWITADARPG